MKFLLKRVVAAFVAVIMVVAVLPFTAYSADWIPSDCKDYVFDAEYYAAKYPEVAEEYGKTDDELYAHFQEYGVDEGKQGSPTFSVTEYLRNNESVSEQFGTDYKEALLHYCDMLSTTVSKPSPDKFLSGTFDAVISRAEDTANGAFNVGVASSATSSSSGKYNVQALAADITDTKQIWTFKYNDNGSYTITNKYTGTVLDVNGASKESGANVSTYNSNGSQAQQWRLLERLPGQYVLAPVHASHFTVLDIGGSTSNGTNVITYRYNHTSAQLFNIQILIPDEIKTIAFDWDYYGVKYPEIAANVGNGENLEAFLYEHYGKFGIMEGRQGSPVFSAKYYLDNNASVRSSCDNPIDALMHYYNTGRNTAGLKTAPSEYIADSFEAIINFIGQSTNLGLKSTATNASNNAWNAETVTQSFNDERQVWLFTYVPETGAYVVTNKAHPKAALDVSGASLANNANLATYTDNGVDNLHQQMYIYERIPGEYSLSPAHSSGKVVEIAGGYTEPGKNVSIYEYNRTVAQRVTLSFYFDQNLKGAVYDEEFYRNKYYSEKNVRRKTGDDLYEHFLSIGLYRGYQGSPTFSVSHYLENNDDVKADCPNGYYEALMHYLNTGINTENYKTAPAADFGEKFTATVNSTSANVNIGVANTSSNADGTVYTVKSRTRNDEADAQKWMFVRNDDGSYTLKNVLSGTVMSAEGGSFEKGTLVNTSPSENSTSQRWFFYERTPGNFVISPAHSSGTLVLGVQESALVEGTQADLYTYLAVPAQLYDVTILDYPGEHKCDVNHDGTINAKDLLRVAKHVKQPLLYAYVTDSDINCDGVIDYADVELVRQSIGKNYGISYKTLTPDSSFTTPEYTQYTENHTLISYDNISLETYEAVYAGFISDGCELYSDTVKGSIHATTFVKGDDFYHMYWAENSRRLRIAEAKGSADDLPSKNAVLSKGVTPSITQLKSSYLNGMGYIVKLSDGTFIVVDGGYTNEQDILYSKLVELNNGSKEKIIIRAWLITHSHNDHYECFMAFAQKYASAVTLERFMYCPETPAVAKSSWHTAFYTGDIYKYVNMFKGVKILTIHTGMEFTFGDVRMEILYTPDDMLIEYNPDDQNEMSVICRFYTDKKNALILGDSGSGVARKLEQYYGNYLKSDICQASHHGVEDFPLSTYNIIRAPIMFYPCSQALYDLNERFDDVRDAIANSDYIKEILIHQHGHYTRSLK